MTTNPHNNTVSYGFIYMTKNKVTGHLYIGKHRRTMNPDDINDSWYLGSGVLLQRAIEKYGTNNFERTILCECPDDQSLNEMERRFISYYNAVDDNQFYNLTFGGDGLSVVPECVRERMRHPHKPMSDKARANMARVFSNEAKAKLAQNAREKLTGRVHSEQSKANMSAGHIGSRSIYKNGIYKYVKEHELQEFLDDGWILRGAIFGKKVDRKDRGTKMWVHKGDEERVVRIDDADKYFDDGWSRGRIYKKRCKH